MLERQISSNVGLTFFKKKKLGRIQHFFKNTNIFSNKYYVEKKSAPAMDQGAHEHTGMTTCTMSGGIGPAS
jgi:hypothetical protein